ncbi:hypothetical protein ACFLZJ_01745 [Nanoarchaeota archaeon]
MAGNLALYIWYAVPMIIGAIIFHLWKKKWWIGAIIGAVVALVAITVLAWQIGG